jgi:hypothetical protein
MPITNEERIGVVETELKEVRADVHQGVAKVIAGLSFIAAAATSTLATLLITLAQ